MKSGLRVVLCCFLLTSLPARAQFFSAGTDPGAVRWSSVRTENYRVIYPRGADSLARAYALSLQMQYPRVGRSIGYAPSEYCRRPMPVVLHSFTSYGNGMVMWAPRRMELYTVGDPGDPDPMPWMLNLTTHEPRHAAQLQFGRRLPYGALRWVVGDLSDVAWWAAFTGIAYSEGDAVVAETGLTGFGRARTADFLEYVRAAFDEGDWRDFYRWRYGSVRYYTPDHYRAGYMLAAGLRTSWNEPLFLKKYQDNLFARRLPFLNLQHTIREVTGLPTVQKAFDAIAQDFQQVWKDNDAFRAETGGGFVSDTALTAPGRRYTAFRGAVAVGDDIYAIETGLEHATRLVRIEPDGVVHVIRPFASSASDLRYADGRLYWSEERRDPRWELAGTSVVRSMDLSSGKVLTLLDAGRAVSASRQGRFYNPVPSEDGSRVAAFSYDWNGGHRVVVLEGEAEDVIDAPAGLQPVQGAWIGDRLYVSAVTDDGFGIYEASADWRAVLPGLAVKIKQLRAREGRLWFVCDRDGANELYSCDPATGALRQETSLRHGGQDFVWNATGDTLRYTVLSAAGRPFRAAPVSAFTPLECAWEVVWRDPVSEKLSAQERALEAADTVVYAQPALSDPQPYRKAAHLLRFHTWAPLYVDYDAVSSMSFSTLYSAATLGATAFFQNDLATATGSIGYSAAPVSGKDWRHLVDLRFNYKGWSPVIETSLQLSNGTPSRYQFTHITPSRAASGARPVEQVTAAKLAAPALSFGARVYLPLVFNGGGWNRGLVPQVRYSISNSLFDGSIFSARRFGAFAERDRSLALTGREGGATVFLQNVTASVRGYAMLPTAPSGVYPRWGIGAETGVGFRPSLTQIYDPAVYGYLYGYLPGLVPEHGLKITGLVQRFWTGDASGAASGHIGQAAYIAEQRVTTYPRGYAACGSALGRYLADNCPTQMKWTADYLMAVLPVDWSGLGPVAYVKNFELGLHGDAAFFFPGSLMSAGASLSVRLGNLLWVPFDTRIGIDWSCNFGPSYETIQAAGVPLKRHYAGFLFSIDY